MNQAPLAVIIALVIIVIVTLLSAIKVTQEYERGVVFRLGRLVGARGPGLILLIPFLERMVRIDLRTVTMDIPAQEVITRDHVTIRVNAVTYFRVLDPQRAVVQIADYVRATSQIAQTTLRNVIGQVELDQVLAEREAINHRLQTIIDEQTEPWGIKVSIVELKDVELPQSMQRAMARQAEAEREKRAKIIHAEGEFEASQQLHDAAVVMGQTPIAIQLRYLQTLTEIATEKNSTVVFPLPIDMISTFMSRMIGAQPDGALPTIPPPGTSEPAAPRRPIPVSGDD
jgi:regulator of protease activity HflC (stomatin/prohibitin superfamily)